MANVEINTFLRKSEMLFCKKKEKKMFSDTDIIKILECSISIIFAKFGRLFFNRHWFPYKYQLSPGSSWSWSYGSWIYNY